MPSYSHREQVASSAIHAIGALLSVAGLAVLGVLASRHRHPEHMVTFAVYGSSLVLLYTSSTLYHSVPGRRAKRILRVLDHAGIYLLIAGTYTPFALVTVGGNKGWTLFGVVWGLALVGIVLRAAAPRIARRVSFGLYLGMGWAALPILPTLASDLPTAGLALLLAGGALYTLGVPLLVLRRIPYNHAIWHFVVLAASVLHYLAIVLYVLPSG